MKSINKKATAALMRARRSVDKLTAALDILRASDLLSDDQAMGLLLDAEDARREMTACAAQLVDTAATVSEAREVKLRDAADHFYCALSEAERGSIYLKARMRGFNSAVDFILSESS